MMAPPIRMITCYISTTYYAKCSWPAWRGPPWLGSTNSHGDLSTLSGSCGLHLFPNACAQFNSREISVLYKPSSSGRTNPSTISLEDLNWPSNRLIRTVWMWHSRISKGALGRPPHSSTRYLWIRLRQWRNYTDGRINIQRWKTISG